MHGSRRIRFLTIALIVIGLGLITRFPGLGPHVFLKYAGSILWGGLIYCAAVIVWPKASMRRLAVVSALFSATVEFSQLWHTLLLDRVRDTTIGVLLIGKYFSWWDIVSYFAGITIVFAIDLRTGKRQSSPRTR